MACRHTNNMRCESGTLRAVISHPRETGPTEHAGDDASSRRTQIASIVQSIAVRHFPDCQHSIDARLQDEPQTARLCAQCIRWAADRLSHDQLCRLVFADNGDSYEWSWRASWQARNQFARQRTVHADAAGYAPRIGQSPNATSGVVPSIGQAGAHRTVLHERFYRQGPISQRISHQASRRRLRNHWPDWHSTLPTLSIEAVGSSGAWLHTWSRENHFRASNESCATQTLVHEGSCYRARRR